ncbi:MAG: hypothetical protein ABW278_13460 [Steroidobacteraceae bacterium]
MNAPVDLRQLEVEPPAGAPYGFGEFERRRELGLRRRRATAWSVAGSVGVLGLVAVLALVTQAPQPAAQLTAAAVQARDAQPALLDLGQFDLTSELQDHIALLDAEISAARVGTTAPGQLRELESTRAELNDSLQRVSYAHSLLGL